MNERSLVLFRTMYNIVRLVHVIAIELSFHRNVYVLLLHLAILFRLD